MTFQALGCMTVQSESASACPAPTHLPTTTPPSSCKWLHTAAIPPTPGHHHHHPQLALHACMREDVWIGEHAYPHILPHTHTSRKVVSVRQDNEDGGKGKKHMQGQSSLPLCY